MDIISKMVRQIPFESHARIPHDALADTEIVTYVDDILRQMAIEMRSMVAATEHGEVESRSEEVVVSARATVHVKVPATWWDAFKLHAIEVSGNPFFRHDKIKWKTVSNTERVDESVQLVTKAISVDLHPDRNFALPREQWGRPIKAFVDVETRVDRKKL